MYSVAAESAAKASLSGQAEESKTEEGSAGAGVAVPMDL